MLIFAEGINKSIPNDMIIKAITMDRLYPIRCITIPEGLPKIKKAEKVAVRTKYDMLLLSEKALSRMGTMMPFIPTPKPIIKNATPMMRRGKR